MTNVMSSSSSDLAGGRAAYRIRRQGVRTYSYEEGDHEVSIELLDTKGSPRGNIGLDRRSLMYWNAPHAHELIPEAKQDEIIQRFLHYQYTRYTSPFVPKDCYWVLPKANEQAVLQAGEFAGGTAPDNLRWWGNALARSAIATPLVMVGIPGFPPLLLIFVPLFLFCGLGGLVITGLGLDRKSWRVFLQGMFGLCVFAGLTYALYYLLQGLAHLDC